VDSNPITLRNLGKCQGKPQCGETQREREISYYYASGKYKTAANPHFQPRKIPHSTKSVPQKSASFSVPKLYCCTAPFYLIFCGHSQLYDCSVWPKNSKQKTEIRLEIHARNASKSMPNPYGCTDCTDPYSTAFQSRKKFRPKTQKKKKNFLGFVPSLMLTFLSQACSENLSNSPPDVFTTCLAHYPMHSFII
jgi:hypothetical protein